MQPFDALTIRAVLQEAKPLLVNRKVDRVQQLGRDEIVLTLRSKAGLINLLMSAQTAYGRLCLAKVTSQPVVERHNRPPGPNSQSSFSMLLRKHLTSATLVGVEQPPGERTVDFIFSCVDEVGGTAHKILTAEIMGRHSNLIFWDKNSEKIVCASHIVTRDMSRQREVAPGLRFVRPPGQEKQNVFSVEKEEFSKKFEQYQAILAGGEMTTPGYATTVEQWLTNTFTGLGRHLAAELIAATGAPSLSEAAVKDEELGEKIWHRVCELQSIANYKPAMRSDLSTYSVLSWWPGLSESTEWKTFPSVNDMVDEYYRLAEAREQFNQLRERLRSELRGETDKLEGRIAAASQHLGNGESVESLKRSGDMVLAHINDIAPGQQELVCENMFESREGTAAEPLTIKLNPNISASQNAQAFYRQFAKSRARTGAASIACQEANKRLDYIRQQMTTVEAATDAGELRQIKDQLIGRKPLAQPKQQQQSQQGQKKNKSRLLSTTSSDGWTIYVGRNRQENDYLLSKLARPFDFWMHVQGQGGAHVLIRVPASKQDPPMTTLKEGAHVAAKLSKASSGAKVRVVYTQCRYVKKLPGDKPGLVHYEKERTLEVDTALPMPKCMKQLFQQN